MFDDIAPNADAFAKQLDAIGQKVEEDIFEKIIRKVLIDTLALIVKDTPIDTGRAKACWMLDTDYSDFVLPPGDYRSAVESGISKALSSLPRSDHYVLFNNLEYIQALEDGHSQQAPSGFVAQALAAMTSQLQKVAQAVGYEVTG